MAALAVEPLRLGFAYWVDQLLMRLGIVGDYFLLSTSWQLLAALSNDLKASTAALSVYFPS